MAADGLAAGKARNGLVDDRLEDRGGEVGLRRALVDEGLNVRLGEHAAARGDGVDLLIVRGLAVETEASVCSRAAIWSINEPVPPAQTPFMRSSSPPLK